MGAVLEGARLEGLHDLCRGGSAPCEGRVCEGAPEGGRPCLRGYTPPHLHPPPAPPLALAHLVALRLGQRREERDGVEHLDGQVVLEQRVQRPQQSPPAPCAPSAYTVVSSAAVTFGARRREQQRALAKVPARGYVHVLHLLRALPASRAHRPRRHHVERVAELALRDDALARLVGDDLRAARGGGAGGAQRR